MKASGTTLRTSTRPAAAACGETDGGSAEAVDGVISSMIAATPTASVRVRMKNSGVSCADTHARGKGAYASVKLRVTAGSTGMPGPVVVEMTIFFRYRPLDDAGLARMTSSMAAP